MEWIVNAREMKYCDENTTSEFLMPQAVLMERAALACFEEIKKRIPKQAPVLVACGSGNNGGDGFCLARLLHLAGYQVTVFLCKGAPDKKSVPGTFYAVCKKYGIPETDSLKEPSSDLPAGSSCSLQPALVVDAVFGTGLNRSIDGSLKETIEALNALPGLKMAVDIPSGISSDTGKVLGVAFRADFTVTFAYKKIGLLLYPGASYAGEVILKDVGIEEHSFLNRMPLCCSCEKADLAMIPERKSDGNKGTFGRVLVIAGSENMCGAAYFSAKAAYLTGAGLVHVYTAEENRIILQQRLPEAILTTYRNGKPEEKTLVEVMAKADIIVAGPGLGTSDAAEKILKTVLKSAAVPLILDADALNLIAKETDILKKPHTDMLITPHMGEMSRLTGDAISYLKEDPVSHAVDFANEYNVICALKDARTVTAVPYGKVYINQSGNCGMATAGSGDVLTGIAAGLAAQGMRLEQAAPLGVMIHGMAGDLAAEENGMDSLMASDILDFLPEVLKRKRK